MTRHNLFEPYRLGDISLSNRCVMANPDLVHRMKTGAPLTLPDEDTFYHGGEKGYTDYPLA